MEPKERMELLLQYANLNAAAFAAHIGAKTKQCIYEILKGRTRSISSDLRSKIAYCYPEINEYWLLTGKGEMLNTSSPCVTAEPVGKYHVKEVIEPDEYVRAPIVPATVAKEPGLDAFEYVQKNLGEVELSNVVVKDMTISVWHKVTDMSMSPRYLEGDYVGLLMCAKPCRVIPGNTYGIDTISNGMIVRKLYPVDGGFRAHALNSEEYPDFIIKCEDIIRIYRKMIQVRL